MDERRTRMGIGVPEAPPDEQASLPEAHVANRDAALAHVTPRTSAKAETISRTFLGISLKRAYRLNIAADEVLPAERAHLESRAAHITDPDQQAFLAWRRSVLLLVAMMFVPLCVFRFLEAFDGPPIPAAGRAFVLLPAIAEAIFCLVMFDQLKHWAEWKRQRRVMFYAWCIYFIAPFIVYAYPFRTAFDHSVAAAKAAAEIGGIHLNPSLQTVHIFVGLAFGVQALLALGPKIISLMPGVIRASIVSKLLFPGATAPGWLMMLAAPIYALFAYIIVLLPYQVTGSWQFVAGNAGILVAQVYIGFCGRRLTVPLSQHEAHQRIHKAWLAYIGILVVSASFMVYGLYDFLTQLHFGVVRVITSVLAVVSNVLLDTLVGTDAIVAAMAHFRRTGPPDPREEQLLREAEAKLEVFTT
jgi:hypothetical protein